MWKDTARSFPFLPWRRWGVLGLCVGASGRTRRASTGSLVASRLRRARGVATVCVNTRRSLVSGDPPPAPPATPGISGAPQNVNGIPSSWTGHAHAPPTSNLTGRDHASGPDFQGQGAHDANFQRQDTRESFFIGSPLSGNRSAGAPSAPNGQAQNFDQTSQHAGARPSPNFDRSPNFGGPFGNSGSSPAMAGAGNQYRPFDPRDWSTDGKKISK